MNISSLNWQQVEDYLKTDDRCILPLGCTEQHAFLSLSTDSILAEKVSRDAAEPLGIPVFPVVPYGITPDFMAYPGTVTLSPETFFQVVTDILDSLHRHKFRRILVVNGHGGNSPVEPVIRSWNNDHPDSKVKFVNWWSAPKTWRKVMSIDEVASHASWMENFPWTRLKDVKQPAHQKKMVDFKLLKTLNAEQVRELLEDGNFGGYFERNDAEMMQVWDTAVAEIRELLVNF